MSPCVSCMSDPMFCSLIVVLYINYFLKNNNLKNNINL